MSGRGRAMHSEYIEWVKIGPRAKYNLATSGVATFPLEDLAAPWGTFALDRERPGYAYEPLQAALAKKCGVSAECVVSAIGASQGIHLPLAALVGAGDEVLIEHPTYDPILSLAGHMGARVKRFHRRHEDGFRVDAEEVARNVSPDTRLIVLTNLHNPSGAFTEEGTLRGIGEIARRVGARVLVNEIYLEMFAVHGPGGVDAARGAVRSAFHLGAEFVAIGSLTKAYGLSGLRCGWILAEPELARRMWRLNDLFTNIPAHVAERLSVIALEKLDGIAQRSRALLETNRGMLDRFLDSRGDIEAVRPPCGTVVFPRLAFDSEKFCDVLREKYETLVVPGKYFEMPRHIRIGIGGGTEALAVGLERLGACLDQFRKGF